MLEPLGPALMLTVPVPTVTVCVTPVVLTCRSNVPLKLKPFPLKGFTPPMVAVNSPAMPAFVPAPAPDLKIITPLTFNVSNVLPPMVAVKVPPAVIVVV